MALFSESLVLDELSADPGSPVEGQKWYNTTEKRFKCYRNATVQSFSDLAELTAHTGDTGNPHTVDLEQARTAGNTLAGDINMNNAGTVTNLTAPSIDGDAATKGYVDDQIVLVQQGLDWQESVLDKDLATPPGTPATGDRYIVAAGGTGAWTGKDGQVTEWDGSAWTFAVPNEGFCTRVEDENKQYIHDGTSWGLWDATQDHGAMTGLGDDDHTQYHNDTRGDARYFQKTEHINSSAGAGDAGKPIKLNASGEVDISMVDNATAQWNADKLQGNDVSAAAPSTDDALVWNGTSWAPAAQTGGGPGAECKAGSVLAVSFTGSPKTAAVTFGTAYSDANYAVSLTAVVSGATAYLPTVSNKLATGFTIQLNTGATVNLTAVDWHTMPHGE